MTDWIQLSGVSNHFIYLIKFIHSIIWFQINHSFKVKQSMQLHDWDLVVFFLNPIFSCIFRNSSNQCDCCECIHLNCIIFTWIGSIVCFLAKIELCRKKNQSVTLSVEQSIWLQCTVIFTKICVCACVWKWLF